MPRSAQLLLVTALLGPLTASPLESHAQPGQRSEDYDALLREALREFSELRFLEARALFQRLHAMRPSARTLRAIGLTEYELGNYVQAAEALSSALTDRRTPLATEDRKAVGDFLTRSQRYIGRVTVSDGAEVTVDGQPTERDAEGVILLNPGKHVLLLSGEHYSVDVVGGETITLLAGQSGQEAAPRVPTTDTLRAPVKPSSSEARAQFSVAAMGPPAGPSENAGAGAWPIVTVAAGGALVAGGVIVGALAVNAIDDYERDCPPTQPACDLSSKSEATRIERTALVGDALWMGGAAVMGAGLLWWILDDDGGEASSTQVSGFLSPYSATASVRGRF